MASHSGVLLGTDDLEKNHEFLTVQGSVDWLTEMEYCVIERSSHLTQNGVMSSRVLEV